MTKKSRQRIWQEKRRRKGLCGSCGTRKRAKKKSGKLAALCAGCGGKRRKYAQKRNGWKPRKRNGVGRPRIY